MIFLSWVIIFAAVRYFRTTVDVLKLSQGPPENELTTPEGKKIPTALRQKAFLSPRVARRPYFFKVNDERYAPLFEGRVSLSTLLFFFSFMSDFEVHLFFSWRGR